MCSYAIVLRDDTYGPAFPSLDDAASWALADLPEDCLDGWVSVVVTERDETSVSTGIVLPRNRSA